MPGSARRSIASSENLYVYVERATDVECAPIARREGKPVLIRRRADECVVDGAASW
jgi:hypothetical protein